REDIVSPNIFSSLWNGSVWSAPNNIGRPYNSSADDLYFSIDADGYFGLLASNRKGTDSVKGKTCCTDIYTIYRSNINVDLITKTFTEEGEPLNGSKVYVVQMINGKQGEFDMRVKEEANEYNFQLQRNLSYRLYAVKDGYFPDSLDLNTVGIKKSKTFEEQFKLRKIPPPAPVYDTITSENPIRLSKIYYDFDDAKILPAAEEDLTFLLGLMNDYPDMVIELSSHTDSQGSGVYNQKLSQKRADSAKKWLIDKGIVDERIKAVGYGEKKILNQCKNGVRCTDEEHGFNRRTEFSILEGPTTIKIEKKVRRDGKEFDPTKKQKDTEQ
ncbi:MAG: OmpA family protein, partial [Bacteroidota bacterium]